MDHREIYGEPAIYEIAFSYRDIPRQCDFLTEVCRLLAGQPPASVLELACGPAVHAREFARRGAVATAMDISPEMVAYAQAKLGEQGRAVVGDMAEFSVSPPVDLAFTLLDSLPYLTTNARLISHLRSVRRSVRDGGVYVAELRHPSDVFPGGERTTLDEWTIVAAEGLSVTTEWGVTVRYDPLAQTETVTSRLTVQKGDDRRVIESSGVLRPLMPQELLLLVDLAGGWRFGGWWGDFRIDRPLGGSAQDWRMIVALQAV